MERLYGNEKQERRKEIKEKKYEGRNTEREIP